MHRPTHLGVIIHFTEFEATAVKRSTASLLLAVTGKLWQGVRTPSSKVNRTLGKIPRTYTSQLPVRYCKWFNTQRLKKSAPLY